MGEHKDPRFTAWYGNLQATMRSLQRIEREVEEATGLPMASIEVLVNIGMEAGGRIRMSELADTLLLSRGGATRLVARLEDAGLVDREVPRDDRRATFAVVTDKGAAMVERAMPILEGAAARHYLDHLNESELRTLRGASLKILEDTGSNCDWLVDELRAAESGTQAPLP